MASCPGKLAGGPSTFAKLSRILRQTFAKIRLEVALNLAPKLQNSHQPVSAGWGLLLQRRILAATLRLRIPRPILVCGHSARTAGKYTCNALCCNAKYVWNVMQCNGMEWNGTEWNVMYACGCACMHACNYVYMHTCMCACMHVCMCVCMYVCMFVCTYVRTHARMQAAKTDCAKL